MSSLPINLYAPLLNLTRYSGIKFSDGTVQPTSAETIVTQNTPPVITKITQSQLPSVIDTGTF